MIRSSILDTQFHMDFPYETFPWRLEVNKDNHNIKGIALTVCHFECKEHMEKYLDRYNFKPKDVKKSQIVMVKPMSSNVAERKLHSHSCDTGMNNGLPIQPHTQILVLTIVTNQSTSQIGNVLLFSLSKRKHKCYQVELFDCLIIFVSRLQKS